MLTIEEMAIFCKKKGFIYSNSEIYGGLSGFFDYGPLGVELKNNIKSDWWKFHVHQRDDIVGIDGAIIANPNVWKASGHVDSFTDFVLSCNKCKTKYRADHLIEDVLKIEVAAITKNEMDELIKKHKIVCPKCKGELSESKEFNLMFQTQIGPVKEDSSIAYLRPETAQLIFADFKAVVETSRLKLPFGIAQMGKAFRNEISPRDFLFRCREFEQMEIEFFVHPKKQDACPYMKDVENIEINVYSADMQKKKQKEIKISIKQLLAKKIICTQWHAYWLATEFKWFTGLGVNPENFRIRQHLSEEKSHYALDTWDLEYRFPFGWKELQGMANRTDFDLQQHIKFSKQDLSLYDEETKQKVVPYVVAEPSQGVERAFLVFMFDSYNYDDKRGNIVLKLHPKLAPIKAGVFPLVNKLDNQAKKIFDMLKIDFNCLFDRSGSIGRRYARADEIGIPYCITIDFDSNKKKDVTIRDRNTTKQIRVKVKDLKNIINKLLNQEIKLDKAGKSIK